MGCWAGFARRPTPHISDRPYRKAWSEMEALEYIRQQAGLHFDPVVVKTFLELSATKRNVA